jgi:DNA-binding MarR family transcriptional regulator/N-acetylglutamate synthase-like GNAT family acetyltransferase
MQSEIDRVRSFNRFYTRRIGVISPHYLDSEFSLAELRTLYEVALRSEPSASQIGEDLGIDQGYLSRILRSFEKRGLIARESSKDDARRRRLSLTKKGRLTFDREQARTSGEIGKMLKPLSPEDRAQLLHAMQRVETLLSPARDDRASYVLRPHQPGDMGWVIHRHAALYWREYAYDQTFEALVAEIAAKFLRNFDAQRERCWIAERNGEIVGSVFLVKQSKHTSKLRLLLVEPSARGLGIGRRLVEECIRFAREAGYKRIVLWTESNLTAARATYKKQGFKLVRSMPNTIFGGDRVNEIWARKL